MKEQIINDIIRIEGGYVNDSRDSGGETNYGITIDVAKANGYYGKMQDMPREVAFDIYAIKYWDSVRGDALIELSTNVAQKVVDTSVNMGPRRAGEFLQRALNVLIYSVGINLDNLQGTTILDVDGIIGPDTLEVLRIYLSRRNEDVTLIKAFNCLQGEHYIRLAEKRPKDRAFIYGWIKNRINL